MLLDFQMPKMTGLDVVKKLKKFFSFIGKPKTKVMEPEYVFLTAYSTKLFLSHLKALGINQCYEKPLAIEKLKSILQATSEKESMPPETPDPDNLDHSEVQTYPIKIE